MLILLGGLTGVGKSTLARAIETRCGAVRLDADDVRKELWGCSSEDTLPYEAYAPNAKVTTQELFRTIFTRAELSLRRGKLVVISALFVDVQLRANASLIAASLGVKCAPIWCRSTLAIQEERIRARMTDRADGSLRAVREQMERIGDAPPADWEVLDTSGALPETVASLFRLLDGN